MAKRAEYKSPYEYSDWKPRPKPAPLMSDAEQRQIDAYVDNINRMQLDCRVVPEEEWGLLNITPIDQVPHYVHMHIY